MPEAKGLAGSGAGERILATATHLFSRHGYNSVSTRAIASAAQVNEGTIFRHYPRKHDLYLAGMKPGLRQLHLRCASGKTLIFTLIAIVSSYNSIQRLFTADGLDPDRMFEACLNFYSN